MHGNYFVRFTMNKFSGLMKRRFQFAPTHLLLLSDNVAHWTSQKHANNTPWSPLPHIVCDLIRASRVPSKNETSISATSSIGYHRVYIPHTLCKSFKGCPLHVSLAPINNMMSTIVELEIPDTFLLASRTQLMHEFLPAFKVRRQSMQPNQRRFLSALRLNHHAGQIDTITRHDVRQIDRHEGKCFRTSFRHAVLFDQQSLDVPD